MGNNLIGIANFDIVTDDGTRIVNQNCNFTAVAGDLVGTDPRSPIDPLLAPLADNGGPTSTHSLRFDSPAINTANPACTFDDDGDPATPEVPLTIDQRGFTRPVDDDADGDSECDIGAFELNATPPPVDLSVTKTDSPDPVAVGSNLTYTITISNRGPNDAVNVFLEDTFSELVTFGSAIPSQGECRGDDSLVLCDLGSLANGVTITVEIIVRPRSPGILENTASASVGPFESDPDLTNNSDTEETTVNPVALPVTCNGLRPTMGCLVNGAPNQLCLGTLGDDTIVGTAGADVIHGLDGNDTITGLGGNDVICSGSGFDTLSGGEGRDRLFGDGGRDTLRGGVGDDTLSGGQGVDRLFGGRDRDTLRGDGGDDALFGQEGNDALDGGIGFDQCIGGVGTDSATRCERVRNVL